MMGSYGEGSSGVHTLVTILMVSRVYNIALQHHNPGEHQMGLEVSIIHHHISTAADSAENTLLLLGRMGQVGEGSGLAVRC